MPTDVIAKKLFTVDDFYLMGEAGILREDCRYELIRGEVIEVSPAGSAHASRVKRLIRVFTNKLKESAIVSVQDPVVLDRYSVPLPDVALLRPKKDFYSEAHPEPKDILLVVEVADTSLNWDRTIKAGLYAETGISEYWVLDVQGDALIVHSDLNTGCYESVAVRRRGETIRPTQLLSFEFSVAEILGE